MPARRKKKTAARPPARRGRRPHGRRILLGVILAAVLAAVLAAFWGIGRSPAEVPLAVTVSRAVGSAGGGAAQLSSPRSVAVAPDGDLYVADLGNSRVAVFGPDGTFKFAFGRKGPAGGDDKLGEFNEPSGVAVGPDGTVFVADAWNQRVQRFSPAGKPLGAYGGAKDTFYSPRTVAVDAAGNLYVGDTGNSEVKVIDPSGRLIKTLGGHGSGDGGFSQEVFGVAVDAQGDVFVADHGNHRIHKFGPLPACAWIKDRKVPGWEASDPFWPQLAVDRNGFLYATDSVHGKVWIYDKDLHYRATLGGGQGRSPLGTPVGIACLAGGGLWITDLGSNRLLQIAPFTVPASQ